MTMEGLEALLVVPQGIELAPLLRALERLGYPGCSAPAGRLECVVIERSVRYRTWRGAWRCRGGGRDDPGDPVAGTGSIRPPGRASVLAGVLLAAGGDGGLLCRHTPAPAGRPAGGAGPR